MKVDFAHDTRGLIFKTTYLIVQVIFSEEEIHLINSNRIQNSVLVSFGKGDQKQLNVRVKDLIRGPVSIPVTNRFAAANIQDDIVERLQTLKHSLTADNPRQSTFEI